MRLVADLFPAARAAFRHLEPHCFDNGLYEGVRRDNRRRRTAQSPTLELPHRHGPDLRAIFAGDAAMSPREISHPGGADEQRNAESGATRLASALFRCPRGAAITG